MTAGKERVSPHNQKPLRPTCEKIKVNNLNGLDNNVEVEMDIDGDAKEKGEDEKEWKEKDLGSEEEEQPEDVGEEPI